MSVRLVLDNKDHAKSPFRAGSNVTGTVEIRLKSATLSVQQSFPHVALSWTCSSDLQFERKIWLTTGDPITRTFKSAATLYRQSLLLTKRTFVPAASQRGEDGGVLSYPFSVTVPAFAEPIPPDDLSVEEASGSSLETSRQNASEAVMYAPDDPWPGSMTLAARSGADIQPQRLPNSSKQSFYYSSGPLTSFEGSINYALHASLPEEAKDPMKSSWRDVSSTSETVTVSNMTPDPSSESMSDQWVSRRYETNVRGAGLADGGEDHRIPFWKRPFNKTHGPDIGLRIELRSKSYLFLNSRSDEYLPFQILIQRTTDNPKEEGASPLPKIFLTRLCISLKGHVAARTNPSQQKQVQHMPYSADGLDKRDIFDWKAKKNAKEEIPLETVWDVGSQLGVTYDLLHSKITSERNGKMRAMDLVEDFCLPNLIRNYSLCWDMKLECGGTEVEWSYGGEGELGLPVTLQDVEALPEALEDLPAYEPV